MRLTTFTDYSLRVLIFLATAPEERATVTAIADSYGISVHHLNKVVNFLGKSGRLVNKRGKNGGLQLAVQAKAIRIGELVREAEGSTMAVACFDEHGSHCSVLGVCRLTCIVTDAVEAFYASLDKYTLADVVENRQALARILFAGGRPPSAVRTAKGSVAPLVRAQRRSPAAHRA